MPTQSIDVKTHTYQKIFIVFLIIFMIVFTFMDFKFIENPLDQNMIKNTIIRFLGGIVFIVVMIGFNYSKVFRFRNIWKSMLIMIPALIISINNFPVISFLDGRATLTEPVYQIFLFLIECLSVGFFEEIVFRGIILIYLLTKLAHRKNGVLLSIVISSAIFGLSHIINLFSGLSLSDTILQVGYSFLVGMMWAIMFLKTGNLWLTMLLHATYNFFGQVMFYLGTVNHRYDIYTILITTILGFLAAIYCYKLMNEFKNNPLMNINK